MTAENLVHDLSQCRLLTFSLILCDKVTGTTSGVITVTRESACVTINHKNENTGLTGF